MRILSESYNNGYGSGNGGNGNGAPGSGNNSGNGNNGNGGNGNRPPRRPSILMMILSGLMTVIAILMLYNAFFGTGNGTEVSYTDFLKDLEADKVEAVEVNKESGVITVQLKKEAAATPAPDSYVTFYGITQKATQSKTVYYTMLMEDLDTLTGRLQEHGVTGTRISSNTSSFLMEILVTVVLPVVLIWVVAGFLFRKMGGSGGPMGVGKSNAKVYVQKETGVTFKDVAGEDEAKESLVEVVDFLHNPQKYSKIGAKLPKGALLVGPPGTGKTLLAKAVAGEAHVPFFSLTGSDFIELYVGVGASRVRDLFKEATKNAPCIVFIDEIDAIGRSRDSKYGGGNEEREQTLNQLLSEMDGFDSSKGILILGATNRPEILDKALLRPGRFDRRIIVDKPDLKGRVEILKVHAKDVKMDETVDLDAIALATSGAVGSDLANMINEAAINAVKEGREFVSQKDLFAAVEQVLVGKEKKDRIMSKEERRIVSYHEVGHALISALQKNSEPVQKITIVPRTMGALGYVMQVPEEEKYLNTEAELRDMLVGLVGGRAAEEVVFDTVTTGAANDIEKATSIARNMITRYGMSKRFGLVGLATVESQYLEGRTALNCSDETAAAIDEEVVAMIKESYDQALQMLRENRELMDKLAAFLIERETITGKEFMEIFRREKGLPDPEEEKKDAAEGATGQKTETKKDETDNTVADAMKGNNIDVTIGEQVMTSTDPTFQPLAFEDSLQEAKEQTTSENATKETAGEASQSDAAVEKPENKTETSAESKDSKDPKDPPQGPVGLFSHGTIS
ncbi:ATP-dependent zinc metalloprotease FtsH [Simiaoa sunii]|jgi:cell division protease FtsH|uniref:ATP-dependent zinc metalloprotease FtsH n=1 Tax=Simiaoa sunii TaxID=2763672 RepID=A0A7G9FV01_9FIRM|nr:ATP-dependent zinc metalloprotease FtsH [Simiaoa sunii]QNM02383.1 ATP-dependent metallopeptidase FtsH/Yme1/Tma family protein [Simiaoa sunii]